MKPESGHVGLSLSAGGYVLYVHGDGALIVFGAVIFAIAIWWLFMGWITRRMREAEIFGGRGSTLRLQRRVERRRVA